MAGLLIGLFCGAGELFLLTRLTCALQKGESLKILGIVFCKLVLFAAAIVPVVIYFRSELLWCGIGISSALIVGAFIVNIVLQRKGKGDR
ncbi:MAG TPA: hypothetical protein VN417_00910 [Candidatus Cryosericum sp.]|nr:hypothetical protein [Candidatus Cryosericum sp.]